MAYTTTLVPGVTVRSRDVRLTRSVGREHIVSGLGFPARVWQNLTTGRCSVYVDSTSPTTTTASLSKAYAYLLDLTKGA